MLDNKKEGSKGSNLWFEDIISLFKVIDDNLFLRMSNIMIWERPKKLCLGNPVFGSIIKTLETINFSLSNRSISDVYVLLRKVRDDALFAIMLLDLIDKYNIAYISGEKFNDSPSILTKTQIGTWFNSFLDAKEEKQKIGYTKFISYFTSDSVIKEFIDQFYLDKLKLWNKILNNHVHGNSVETYFDNISFSSDTKIIRDVKEIVFGLTSFVISIIILIDSSLLMSSDYADALDVAIEPPLNSQYWVAPVFTKYLTENFKKEEIEYLRKNQKSQMEF